MKIHADWKEIIRDIHQSNDLLRLNSLHNQFMVDVLYQVAGYNPRHFCITMNPKDLFTSKQTLRWPWLAECNSEHSTATGLSINRSGPRVYGFGLTNPKRLPIGRRQTYGSTHRHQDGQPPVETPCIPGEKSLELVHHRHGCGTTAGTRHTHTHTQLSWYLVKAR